MDNLYAARSYRRLWRKPTLDAIELDIESIGAGVDAGSGNP